MLKNRWSWIAVGVAFVGLGAGWIGWLHFNSAGSSPDKPTDLEHAAWPGPDTDHEQQDHHGKAEPVEVYPDFDDGSEKDREKTMRFGLILPWTEDPKTKTVKKLSWHPLGLTSNACLKIDGKSYLFGHAPGTWVKMSEKLGKDADGRQRLGRKSVWRVAVKDAEPVVQVTQTVEIVRGPITGKLDTCRVIYKIKNLDAKAHEVGLRYMLDTLVGRNDGAPFIVPMRDWLVEKQWEINNPKKIPSFVFALESLTLNDPGVVAQIGLKLPAPVHAPDRVTLGGWPNEDKVKGALGGLTLWDVPVIPLNEIKDSAATMYWDVKELAAGKSREVGFTYGLGRFTANKNGKLGFFIAGSPRVDGELIVTALIRDAEAGQLLTLKPSADAKFVASTAEQSIFPLPQDAYPLSPITWTVRPTTTGKLTLRVETGTESHEDTVEITGR